VSAASIFSQIVTGPDDFFQPPSWLLLAISKIASSVVTTPTSPSIQFATTNEALDHNTHLLTSHNGDLGAMLRSQPGTFLQYGTEFRPVEQIEQILGTHPNFAFFRKVLTHGMSYHFTRDLSESERVQELTLQLARGNHKSASEKLEVASRLLNKDVAHGFSLPVHASIVPEIQGAMVEPCGIATQFKLQPDGSRELADRLTQDLSYSITTDDASVNKRIKMSEYTDMVYGWCLGRIIHFIVALRFSYPSTRIFINKYDYSDAYRRIHHSSTAAVQSIIVLAGIAYIALRLNVWWIPEPTHMVLLLRDGDRSGQRNPAVFGMGPPFSP
jgi:hypothetical protein